MLKKYNYLLSLMLLAMLVISCHSDVGEVNPATEQTNQITVPYGFDEIEGDLVGYIFDESNNPIVDAKVTIYSDETFTNDFGTFTFQNAKFDPQGTFVKVEKDGFLVGSDLVYPNTNGQGTAKIMMLKILNESSFEASEGGIIEIQGGGTISFPPSSLIRANGSTYDGEVKSTVYRLSPIDTDLGNQMAGGLLGLDKKGRHRVLSTFGMLDVELRGFDNQKLRIKSNKVADLTFPIDGDVQSALDGNVPVWHFDFQDGLWYENNISSNDKQHFKTTIDALGFWNFALPDDVAQVCGRLVYNNELPAKNYTIQIINNGLPSRIGITDNDGFFCGKMPLGENLKFQVLHPMCGELLKEVTIGPFEAVGTIGDIVIDVDEKYISGTIECNGELVSNSTIIIKSNGTTNVFSPNANGSFGINLDEVLCGSTSSYSIFAYDNVTQEMSQIETLTPEFAESLRLQLCDVDCQVFAEFDYKKDDYCADGDYNRVDVVVEGGSGNYTYLWSDGSSEPFLTNPPSGQEICVIVTDQITECEFHFCNEVSSYKRLGISSIYSSNTECLFTSGVINLTVEGGKEPLEYNWTGPDGFVSDETQLENLLPGAYTVTIQDAAGCQVIETNVVHDVTQQPEWVIDKYCNQTVITIIENQGYEPYTYTWNQGVQSGNQLFISAPGFYKVTITDANSCATVKSIEINTVGLLPTINPAHECEIETVMFSELQKDYEYYFKRYGTNDKISVAMVSEVVEVPILEAGYRFYIGSENSISGNCFTEELIELPRFTGLTIENVNATSCESCTDGSVEYDININEDCIDCGVGEVIILSREDKKDVTVLNTEEQLGKGEYYVIVLDSNSGCYIAHSLIEIE